MLFTFLNIQASDTASMVNYGASLISDFMPILVIILGIGIAIWIIKAILASHK